MFDHYLRKICFLGTGSQPHGFHQSSRIHFTLSVFHQALIMFSEKKNNRRTNITIIARQIINSHQEHKRSQNGPLRNVTNKLLPR